jgi:hypothetical protein
MKYSKVLRTRAHARPGRLCEDSSVIKNSTLDSFRKSNVLGTKDHLPNYHCMNYMISKSPKNAQRMLGNFRDLD